MRYAIFSDIHGNLQAWNAIRQDMADLQADVLVCLGDVVGYGPLPEEVLTAIREVTPNFVLGNHDAAAVGLLDASLFNAHAESVINWTSDQLSQSSKDFLLDTPLAIEEEDLFFVHAEITEPGLFGYIETADDAKANFANSSHFVTFIGHTHHPLLFDLDEAGQVHSLGDQDVRLAAGHRYIVNVGSVGEPRNPDDIRARYVIYDSDTCEVYFRRVEFDPEAYRRDLAATSLEMTPYFLKVVDHQVALEAEAERALMMDMQAPASLPHYATQARPKPLTRRLLQTGIPSAGSRTKPKPIPNRRRQSPWPIVAVFSVTLLAMAVGYFVFLDRDADPEPVLKVAPVMIEAPPPPATIEPLGDPVAATEKPEPQADPTPGIGIAASDVAPDPGPEPGPEPVEVVGPSEPQAEHVTVAYWRMEEESPGATLADWTGANPLQQLAPARSINALAPDVIPLTGDANAHSFTLGAWIESDPSGAFSISADRSFTFEGWIMTDKSQRPIFVAGTKAGEAAGWRLHLSAAKNAVARGSMRVEYQGRSAPIVIQTDEIELFDPVPHHFALVWDHDARDQAGKLQLFYDAAMVGQGTIEHSDLAENVSAFRLGDSSNPDRVAIDEVRFSATALAPPDFLSRGRGPNTITPPAFMIDVGKKSSLYLGSTSPAHADGTIPIKHTTWILANAETDDGSPGQTVKLASGENHLIPLEIDLGASDPDQPGPGIAWENQGGETIRPGDREGSVFALDLMDSSQDPDGELSLGIRVRGLEPGDYTVYFSPLVADELGEDIRFGLGVDLASDPGSVTEPGDKGMQEFRYKGGSADDKDSQWVLDRNYFKHEVAITSPEDYVVAIVWKGAASTAIPFLQIVKHTPSTLR